MHYRHINIAENIQRFTPEAKSETDSFQYWSVSILSLGAGSECELCGQKHLVYCYSAVHNSDIQRFFNVGSSCVKRFKNFSLYDENGEAVHHARKDKVFARAERKWKKGLLSPVNVKNEEPLSIKRRVKPSVNSPSFVLNSTNPAVIQNAIDSVLLLAKDPASSKNESVEKCRRFFADLSRTDGYAFSQTVRVEARKQYKLLTK